MIKLVFLSVTLSLLTPVAQAAPWEVIDGDTIVVPNNLVSEIATELGLHLRIKGVDTPEIKCRCPIECKKAQEAKLATKRILDQGKSIEINNIDWDKYGGRINADVYVDGLSVAKELLSKGLARPYDGGKKESWCS